MKNAVMQKVTVVIPAYNEGEQLSKEIEVLKVVPEIDEIILIDDCSQDEFVKSYARIDGIKLVRNEKNLGKGLSVQKGISLAQNNEVLILDADLVNLTQKNVSALLQFCKDYELVPIIRGADIGLGKVVGTTFLTRGEHYIKKSALKRVENIVFDSTRWGFDNNINDVIYKNLCRYAFCEIKNLNHIVKTKKYNPVIGVISDIKMGFEVIIKKYKLYKFILYRWNFRKKINQRKIIEG